MQQMLYIKTLTVKLQYGETEWQMQWTHKHSANIQAIIRAGVVTVMDSIKLWQYLWTSATAKYWAIIIVIFESCITDYLLSIR